MHLAGLQMSYDVYDVLQPLAFNALHVSIINVLLKTCGHSHDVVLTSQVTKTVQIQKAVISCCTKQEVCDFYCPSGQNDHHVRYLHTFDKVVDHCQ